MMFAKKAARRSVENCKMITNVKSKIHLYLTVHGVSGIKAHQFLKQVENDVANTTSAAFDCNLND